MLNETHYINRSGWLRAAVLGANDGILSTTSLAIGIAAASDTRSPIVLAALAGLVAGALSMAAGEYVSVSSQSDIEKSDLQREIEELKEMPESELEELTQIYILRGLSPELAREVALQLTAHNALESHARDELGINEMTQAKPMQAALASALAFLCGGILPLLVALFGAMRYMVPLQYGFAILFLAISGTLAAKAGGSNKIKSVVRICIWGTVAMAASALVGYVFGVQAP
ncbi:VIT1/CCC1 family predicted Fe2+/Mn2+ transporter [Flavobacterium gossypii]|uniref:VIT1/CCC1 family predicted Fe2+/Mn2+ transporter n=2 Tax=Flavobacterium TaxID=237 RepID=A0A495M1V6_9FLAO|nr:MULTISPECIES: VIT family protein [Flavobacterium]MBA9074350.1 VIT1/CCC1 family predicted Fe2+/Mn2+ transporter [Flavobacterium gossypii]RKS19110.1 VIT1/CCC1 family predicted Fe2+/Mn2+ transporter [Flavobacterium endophyticum]WDO11547.1 VIT family protein [Flavobacterium sp. WW92]